MFFLDFGSGKSAFIGVAFSFFAGTAMKRDADAPAAGIAKDFARDKAPLHRLNAGFFIKIILL